MSEPKITHKKLADYQNDPRNANQGSPRGLGVIEDSLNYSGVGRSLVADKNGVLIAGNKTSDAAAIAGIEDVIEIETDGNALIVHKRRDLDLAHDARAKALAVSDNRASELSLNWDNEQLAELLTEIKNEDENLLKATGYYDNELDTLLQNLGNDALALDYGNAQEGGGDYDSYQAPESTVRMVQLFFDVNTVVEFNHMTRALADQYQTKTITDTVLEAVRRACHTNTIPLQR